MSEYRNVVGGKLKLKGKALDVKAGGVKKKKKSKHSYEKELQNKESEAREGEELEANTAEKDVVEQAVEGQPYAYSDHLTPAERRYIEQRERIDVKRMAKTANKSHRDRIQDFNQYLANLSEHYDIPKVGPG